MLGHSYRVAAYKRQTKSDMLTAPQRKRARKKLGHYLAKQGNTAIRTIKL